MDREDIIRMAREAGISESHAQGMQGFLERFVTLVAAAEREACAKVVEILIPEQTEDGLIGHTIAKAIRARGEQ